MGFDWKEFLTSTKIVVHCSTEEQAKDFCKKMHNVGLTWCTGDSYLDKTDWNFYKENTCYFSDGCFERLQYAIESNHKVIEWSNYMVKESIVEKGRGKPLCFNWEVFNSNTKLAVHCSTEEQATNFCSQMDRNGIKWVQGIAYTGDSYWLEYKGNPCYCSNCTYYEISELERQGYVILEWSDYMTKEEKMEETEMFEFEEEQDTFLDLGKLTEEQSKTLLTMFKGFEEENLKFQSRLDNDFLALRNSETNHMLRANEVPMGIAENCFDLGLYASTEEEALSLYKYLLVRKELLEWVEKCPERVDYNNKSQTKYELVCDYKEETLSLSLINPYAHSDIVFTDTMIGYQALASIGKERLMREYFGLGNK